MSFIKNIIALLWLNPLTGSINRVGYLQGFSAIIFLFILFIISIIGMTMAIEILMGGNVEKSQKFINQTLNIPFMAVSGITFVSLFFANANLVAKRLRNIGLPGWFGVTAIICIDVILLYFFNAQSSFSFRSFLFLALLLCPSHVFSPSTNSNV